jgi:tRNA threonylcarbamoyladenosine biosynthesis protein TsaE
MAPFMSDNLFVVTTTSAAETTRLGESLGRLLQSGDVLCLSGELGAGKTTLTRGMARGWGARENPTSPTFTLVNEYTRAGDEQRFYHMDGYRLSGAVEAQTTAFEDILDAPGVIVIEWPERIAGILPDDRLWMDIVRSGDEQRTFTLKLGGDRAAELAHALVAHHASTSKTSS